MTAIPFSRRAPVRRVRALVLALGVVGLLVLAAMACVSPYQGKQSGLRVAVVGDSIMAMTESVVHDWLDPNYLVSVTAVGGQRVDQMQWAVDQYASAPRLPDVVVLDLGTNDSWQNWDMAATEGGLDHMAAQFPDACVIFTTITTRTGLAVLDANAAAINDHIRASGHRTLDWDAMIGYFGDGLLALPDRIHPSEWGKQMLAAAAEQSIAGCS